ncbi:MAG: GNAT family N-acetyltransferase [Bacteroidales bacterium]|nr:GNAT family N-acetyltransferase [Bacteroidales bacterium]MCF8390174.1 GNAT family N-acetyltransferase [Bacteroidales bacterium]
MLKKSERQSDMTKDFYFTDFKESDFNEIQELWVATGMGNPERGDTAKTITDCNNHGGRLIIMKETTGNEIIGTSWLTFDGRRLFLHHFGIKPDWQGKGMAKQLAEETLKFIKSQGVQVKLEVHKDNFKAKKLYKDLGFSNFEDYEVFMLRDV